MRGAGLCLGGPFGDSRQAQRVITGKALQFLACECPTVIGHTGETKDIFEDKRNCLLVELGNPQALADAISWAYHHQGELPAIARQGRLTYEKYYSMDVLSQNLNKFIDSILKESER
jgi:glycosyltransferase involved in cell wall biosynthesis